MDSIYEELWMLRAEIIGDVIPVNWCKTIRKDNSPGEPDIIACLILANIIAWYMPIKEIDVDMEMIHFFGFGQKFSGSRLRRDYQYYSNCLGVSDTMAREAINNLVRLKLITEEIEYTYVGSGIDTISMYLEPNIEKVFGITWPEE